MEWNNMDDRTVTPEKTPEEPWYKVWMKVYLLPTTSSYQEMLQAEGATTARAVTWIVIGTIVTVSLPILLYAISGGKFFHDDLADSLVSPDALGWVMYVVSAVIAVILAAIFFSVSVNIIGWFSEKLGGSSDRQSLGFLLGAIWAPSAILDSVVESIFLPAMGLPIRGLLILYGALLLVTSLRAANGLSWGKALVVLGILVAVMIFIVALFMACASLA